MEAFASPLMYLLILSGEAMTMYETLSGRYSVPAKRLFTNLFVTVMLPPKSDRCVSKTR